MRCNFTLMSQNPTPYFESPTALPVLNESDARKARLSNLCGRHPRRGGR